jgi:hypothetical protein
MCVSDDHKYYYNTTPMLLQYIGRATNNMMMRSNSVVIFYRNCEVVAPNVYAQGDQVDLLHVKSGISLMKIRTMTNIVEIDRKIKTRYVQITVLDHNSS